MNRYPGQKARHAPLSPEGVHEFAPGQKGQDARRDPSAQVYTPCGQHFEGHVSRLCPQDRYKGAERGSAKFIGSVLIQRRIYDSHVRAQIVDIKRPVLIMPELLPESPVGLLMPLPDFGCILPKPFPQFREVFVRPG